MERSFSASEFLEGAKDAYFIMHQLISEQDWETLRPMVSAKLLDALRRCDIGCPASLHA